MKEKIISLFCGILLGAILCSGYHTFIKTTPSNFGPGNMEMTDERLEQTAQRLSMTKEELQKELDSGKTMREIMQEKGANFSGRTGSGGNRNQNQ